MSEANISGRLEACFQTVFPKLSPDRIRSASQDSVLEWDSVASIMLINVIDDEFHVTLDLERVAEYTSFDAIQARLFEQLAGQD